MCGVGTSEWGASARSFIRKSGRRCRGRKLEGELSMRTIATIMAGIALAGTIGHRAADAAETVTVGFAIPFTVTDGPMFAVAEHLGYFADENIDPEYIFLTGAAQLIPQVASKQITIGQPLPDPMMAAISRGQELPVAYFFNALPMNTIQLGVLETSDIQTLEDFEERSIGVGALTWGTIPGLRAMLRSQGIEPGEDSDIVPVGILGSGFQALRNGTVDGLNYNNTWLDILEMSGTPLRRISLPGTYENMINNAFIAHNDTLEENPELLAGFGRAYAKALTVCEMDPAFCVETFWNLFPEQRPAEGDDAENLAQAVNLLEQRLALITPANPGGTGSWGRFDHAAINEYVNFMYENGEFESTNIPVETIFSNALADAFIAFDPAEIMADIEAGR